MATVLTLHRGGQDAREIEPMTGEELLCLAAEAAADVLRQGLARVPASDPWRCEIEARTRSMGKGA